MTVIADDEFAAFVGPPRKRALMRCLPLMTFQLADALLGPSGAPPRSVWWCADALSASQFACFDALPPPAAFAQLLVAPD